MFVPMAGFGTSSAEPSESVTRIVPDSLMSERWSKHYNGMEGQSVEWEMAVTVREPIHSTLII
jgi:hypothetical protein